jgi:predicted O-methyltransferase YrrM
MQATPGWFNYAPFWDDAVATAPEGATLLEVGVFCGKSLAYLARAAKASGKGLKVVGVDTFEGSPEHRDGSAGNLHELPRFALAALCMQYLETAGVLNDVFLIRAESVKAAALFADASLHAVFLDADHSEEAVRADVLAWSQKVAPGGFLGGDDYHIFPGVKAAVDALVPGATTAAGQCWWEAQRGVTG